MVKYPSLCSWNRRDRGSPAHATSDGSTSAPACVTSDSGLSCVSQSSFSAPFSSVGSASPAASSVGAASDASGASPGTAPGTSTVNSRPYTRASARTNSVDAQCSVPLGGFVPRLSGSYVAVSATIAPASSFSTPVHVTL